MDLLGLISGAFLNLAIGCSAMPAEVQRIGHQDFMIQAWACEDRHGTLSVWRTWSRQCLAQNGYKFWSHPVFIEETGTRLGIYINQFGEIQGGYGAAIENAYLPRCGS